MANPRVLHAHPIEQVLETIPEVPPAVRDRVSRLLVERDVSVEDGINNGLRKEISSRAFGNGVVLNNALPTWAFVGALCALSYEKQHDLSRLEIAGVLTGEMSALGGTVSLGAVITGSDNPAFVTVTPLLGQAPLAPGFGLLPGFGNTVGLLVPRGRYTISLAAAISAGSTWTCRAEGLNSIRVVESLY